MSNVRIGLISLFLLLLARGAGAADPPLQTALVPYPARPAAPELVLKDLEGRTTRLAGLRGKVVVVNFWATWCPPCRREFPSMEALRAKMAGKPLVILAVNEGEGADVIEAFLSTLDSQPGFPVLLDTDGLAMRKWPVQGLPTTFVIDKRGRLAYRAVGGREFDHADIVARLNRLLAEK